MRFAVFILIITTPYLAFSQARRAQSLIEKDKLEDAYTTLKKAFVKDSLASAEKYVLSGLFFNPAFERNNLDSAYYYILKAIRAFELIEPKLQSTLSGRGFNLESYNKLKRDIEKSGFARATKAGEEQDFIDFLDEFNTSVYIDSAVTLRNSVAFKNAREADTYQAYKDFFTTYPEASEVPEARERYERLLYEDKTASGKLSAYRNFLAEYPETFHRQEAEKHIFNIITGEFTIEAFNRFLEEYPGSYLKNISLLSIYNLLENDQKALFLANAALSNQQKDSLRNIEILTEQLMIYTINNGHYLLINAEGEEIIGQLGEINEADKCTPLKTTAFLATTLESKHAVFALDGSILAEGEIISMTDEGSGIIKLGNGKEVFFINAGGFTTNTHHFEAAYLTGKFIAFKSKSRWGLESITGIPLLEPIYDSIASFHNFLVLNKGNKWAIHPMEYFYPLLDQETVNVELRYDKILQVDEEHLILMTDTTSALMSKEGTFIVPMEDQSIELVENGYFIDRTDSILDSRVSKNWYYNISRNERWILGDIGSKIDVFYHDRPLFVVDDAELIGKTALRVTRGDSTFYYLSDTTKLLLAENDFISPIRRMGENSSERHFIYTVNNKPRVYSNKGVPVNVGRFDKLYDLGDDYMLRRIKGSSDLLNENGQVVLADIDAATSLGNGDITYLKNGKFGLFSSVNNTLIKPKYDRPITAYSDRLFIATNDNKYGIIDRNDSLLVPLSYNEILYLNDSTAALNSNFRWLFWDLNHGVPLLDNVSDYWLVETSIGSVYKIFKGIGYGIWSLDSGILLNPTFGEINIFTKGNKTLFIAEKWVEEADLVIMLYYNTKGELVRKEILSTAEYEDLVCKAGED